MLSLFWLWHAKVFVCPRKQAKNYTLFWAPTVMNARYLSQIFRNTEAFIIKNWEEARLIEGTDAT